MLRSPLPGAILFACLSAAPAPAAEPGPLTFRVTFAKSVSARPFTGRVYVLLSQTRIEGLIGEPDWFDPEPMFARDVKDWKPGEPIVLGCDALAFPTPLARLPRTTYWVQAVMDFDRGGRCFTTAEGNGYSKAVRRILDPAATGPVSLAIDQVHRERPFRETERVKLVDIESKLLSAFHGKSIRLRAGVVLPKSFASIPAKRYPVVYEIPGFGGNHLGAHDAALMNATDVAGVEMVYVVLDPECRTGHHVFADSDNNGPYSRALVEELIPHIERTYRGLGVPAARLLTGHSSGGWSSLWLQLTYPDFFGGVWSTAPDEVDFRAFQSTNIYPPGTNFFTDEAGRPRAMARRGKEAAVFNRPFSDMEVVVAHGGQLRSLEAVFGSRGPDGRPRHLWDRTTGVIDPRVACDWARYDIRQVLERNWKVLRPRLAGKLHVYVGGDDTYYLERAVGLLRETLTRLGSDAVIEIFPGRDHATLIDEDLRERIAREMAAAFRRQRGR